MPAVQDGSIPNRLTNNLPKNMTNQKMTEYNDLRRVGLTNPHIMKAWAQHFVEHKGFLSELLMYLNKDYNPMAAADRRKKGTDTMRDSVFAKNMTIINNHEFAWRGKAPQFSIYKFTENTAATSNLQTGFGTTEFYITLNKHLGSKDDVIMLNDRTTQLIITAPPTFNIDGTMRCRVKRLYAREEQPFITQTGVPINMLAKGCEAAIIYNIKPEASDFGSRVEWHFGDWYRNFMTTQRYEWDITGLAAHTKTEKTHWFTYCDENGTPGAYWTTESHIKMMRQLTERRENALFQGLPNLDANGQPERDSLGRTYYSGTGFYHQCNRRLRRFYNDFTDFSLIDDMLSDVADDTTNGKPVLYASMGRQLRLAFDKVCRNEFKFNPERLYVNYKGGMAKGGEAAGNDGKMGIKSNFQYYETPAGIFIVSECPYFDNKSFPGVIGSDGHRDSSWRGLFVNISDELDLEGGAGNINLVTMAGRESVVGKMLGMAMPGADGHVSTPVDAHKEMVLDMAGIAVGNPNCLLELSKQRRLS